MNILLALLATGAAAVMLAIGYPYLADHDEHRAARAPYEFLAGLEPRLEPRPVGPLLEPPDTGHRYNAHGYVGAEHHPEDDSVTLTYGGEGWDGEHSQRYRAGQTFAYRCVDAIDSVWVHLYQYRGTSLFHGARSLDLVHFELEAPADAPCGYPALQANTVDIYDAGGFYEEYGLEGPPDPGDPGEPAAYGDAVRHAVIRTPIYIDPYPTADDPMIGSWQYPHGLALIEVNPDDSITVTHADPGGGANATRAYAPGQTFVASCSEHGGSTRLHVYGYRGSIEFPGDGYASAVLLNYGAHARAPVPCEFPGYVDDSVDVVDAGRLYRQYDLGWFDEMLAGGDWDSRGYLGGS